MNRAGTIVATIFLAGVIATLLTASIGIFWLHSPYGYPGFVQILAIYAIKNMGVSLALFVPIYAIAELKIKRKRMIAPMWPCLTFFFVCSLGNSLENIYFFVIQLLHAGSHRYLFFILIFLNTLVAALVAYFPYTKWRKQQKADAILNSF